MEIATLAAGCFWHVEAEIAKIAGVVSSRVGYCGGDSINPGYKLVCTGTTGHAEAVEVTFDPAVISYADLLGAFWLMHDPTTLNRQGPDVGSQYRSAIFYHNEQQRQTAIAEKQTLTASGRYRYPIVTEITAAGAFYQAEDYHQRYLEKQGLTRCY